MATFTLKGEGTTAEDLYIFANGIYEKVKKLRNEIVRDADQATLKKLKEIETNLDVLRKYLKRSV